MEHETCACGVTAETLPLIARQMVDEETVLEMADIFKMLGDPTRLRIINALTASKMCVFELSELLGLSQPAVSHHLKNLRHTRLVKHRKTGKTVVYSLDDHHIGALFDLCHTHVTETGIVSQNN